MAPINGGMPTDCEYQINGGQELSEELRTTIPKSVLCNRPRQVKVALPVDFDAVSH